MLVGDLNSASGQYQCLCIGMLPTCRWQQPISLTLGRATKILGANYHPFHSRWAQQDMHVCIEPVSVFLCEPTTGLPPYAWLSVPSIGI